jgi:hypothetical protein
LLHDRAEICALLFCKTAPAPNFIEMKSPNAKNHPMESLFLSVNERVKNERMTLRLHFDSAQWGPLSDRGESGMKE